MPDYKELYIKMMRASEQAIWILIKAQQKCEELYVSEPGAKLTVIPGKENTPEPKERPDGK